MVRRVGTAEDIVIVASLGAAAGSFATPMRCSCEGRLRRVRCHGLRRTGVPSHEGVRPRQSHAPMEQSRCA